MFPKLVIFFLILSFTFPNFSFGGRPPKQLSKEELSENLDYLIKVKKIKKNQRPTDEINLNNEHANYTTKMQNLARQTFKNTKNNPYIKELFLTDKKLFTWMTESSEALFYSISHENLDMVKFVSSQDNINLTDNLSSLPAVLFSIVIGDTKIIRYLLDHPSTNLNAVDESENNLFHYIFFSSGGSSGKTDIASLFLEEKYFKKISHLLNKPNHFKETPLDFALRDNNPVHLKIVTNFLDKGAATLQVRDKVLQEMLVKFEIAGGDAKRIALNIAQNNSFNCKIVFLPKRQP